MPESFSNRLIACLQKWLPARTLGRCIYWLSRSERIWLKNSLINCFSWFYSVNVSEAEKPVPSGYRHFNAFFTRKLKLGVRPIDARHDSFVCPADGTLAQFGYARETELLQAKGRTFLTKDLLGDAQMAASLGNCAYATIYLAPYNYHRLHMPLEGTLESTLFIPGCLYSVNARTAAAVPNLYAVNERLVCQFRSAHGSFVMVLVGAMNVASISTAWGGEIMPPADSNIVRTNFSGHPSAPSLKRGSYMGHFNMGSTIVVLAPPTLLSWDTSLQTGNLVRVGQRLGSVSEFYEPS